MKSDSPLRVAILGSTYPRSQDDSAVPWQREIVNRTAADGHEVTVIAPSYKGLRSHTIDGIPVCRFRYAPKAWETLTHDSGAPSRVHSPLFKLLAIPYLIAGIISVFWIVFRKKIDVLHVHWPFPHGLMALLPALLLGTKVVSTCHGAELAMGRNSGVIRRVLAFCLKRSDACCANSSHTSAEVKKIADVALNIIPYGATVDSDASDQAKHEGQEMPLLLFCGRLIQRKGIDYLLRALPEVLKHHQFQLVITGEGNRKAEWMELSQRLGLTDRVDFVGFVSNERLKELYQTCDLYVHPAIFDDNGDTEGLGVVLVEALANQKPVIASRVGGIVDVIEDGVTGVLVPEKDETALADAIVDLLSDRTKAERLGRQGYEFAVSHFDWNRITQLQVDVYREVCGIPKEKLKEPMTGSKESSRKEAA